MLLRDRESRWTSSYDSMLCFSIFLAIHRSWSFWNFNDSLPWTLWLAEGFLGLLETFRYLVLLLYKTGCIDYEEVIDIVVVYLAKRYLCSILLDIQGHTLTHRLALRLSGGLWISLICTNFWWFIKDLSISDSCWCWLCFNDFVDFRPLFWTESLVNSRGFTFLCVHLQLLLWYRLFIYLCWTDLRLSYILRLFLCLSKDVLEILVLCN